MNTAFPISASLFPAKVRHAVDEYWHGRVSQASRQQRRGVRDVGSRSEVTGGGQLDAFGNILQEIAWGAGYEPGEVAFRPAKTGAADYSEPFASLGFLRFCKSFFAHLAAHAED
jgi:hypothetical protein